ncbi:DUF3854 domain-containing protein [Pseudanabaena sp. PCC 6802]|uniref:DUF3854 domain-containing protein n=1 Tax=Pseudanabaena sp. PCC 6802 TaxID=118173 RepID=UPI00034C3A1B|nr:DUF3854 domain-containing protein [Pseudanabaena sp. PCC 6802]
MPEGIREDHFQEWTKGSGVSERITSLNVESLTDPQEIDKRLNRNSRRRTKHSDWGTGGWYVSGVDPSTGERHGIGAQFKPDRPRLKGDKPIKYESVSDSESVPLFLDTGDRYYWPNILKGNDAIVITEGAKKAGAGLTAGVPTISVPGVSNGQKQGRLKEYLHAFCKLGRRVYLCFDSDILVKFQVRRALDTLGRLIAECGSTVSVINLPAETKGMDDYIVARGGIAFKALLSKAQTFEEWRNDPTEIQRLNAKEEKCFTQLVFEELYTATPWVCIAETLHRWTGTHYEPSPDAIERRRIWDYCNKHGTVTDDGYSEVKVSYKYANPAIVSRCLEWAKQGTSIDPESVNPSGLNLANGVLSLTWEGSKPTWRLVPHTPDIVYTYCSKVAYQPDIDGAIADQLLIALDPPQRDIFLKTMAAAFDLTTVRQFLRDRLRVLLLKGDGSNGKDTLRETIGEIFAQGLTGCTFSDFQQYDEGRKFPLAKLAYSRINWACENQDNIRLDKLQVLKQVATGDPIDIEPKNKEEYSIKPKAVLAFNINETPGLLAAQEAIRSRYTILQFAKTFKANPQHEGEIQADPRFKHNPEFIQYQVAPALLNKLLEALTRLTTEGIDYTCTDAAIEEARKSSSHLFRWADDIGLTVGSGGEELLVGELYESLKQWYLDNEWLTVEIDSKGKEKTIWLDVGSKSDPVVKASHQMRDRLSKIFPTVKFGKRSKKGVSLTGLIFFDSVVKIGSLGSPPPENAEGEIDSRIGVGSPEDHQRITGGSPDLTKLQEGDPIEAAGDPPVILGVILQDAPKNGHSNGYKVGGDPGDPKNALTVEKFSEGDRVVIKNCALAVERHPKIKDDLKWAVWGITDLLPDGEACCRSGPYRYVFRLEWLARWWKDA